MSADGERVAIVAGAGGELGRATAEKLAAAEFTVAGVDRSEQGLKELPEGIWRAAADPADPAAARTVIDRIAAEVAFATAPVIKKYTGVLAAADVYTDSTAFHILESIRLDQGFGSQVHP